MGVASNSFGQTYRFTTFGESHGAGVGVVIDGCPAGLPLEEEILNQALLLRAPGRSPFTSPRKEADRVEILSGIFEGVTTGAPLCCFIRNRDADSSKYEAIKELLRPGHANFTYLSKYGVFDWRGGGRSSARETAARVIAGAVAAQVLHSLGIYSCAYMEEIGGVAAEGCSFSLEELRQRVRSDSLFCPDPHASAKMAEAIERAKEEEDSVGGIVTCRSEGVPSGLGDPIYEKIEARLAYAMLSIPATKGFEVGSGFQAARMRASENNDRFICKEGKIQTATNHSGGVLGGITNGMPLIFRVAFKPPSSIPQQMNTVTLEGKKALFELPPGSRHDPCVAIRGVPVVEAMTSIVLLDALLQAQGDRIEQLLGGK